MAFRINHLFCLFLKKRLEERNDTVDQIPQPDEDIAEAGGDPSAALSGETTLSARAHAAGGGGRCGGGAAVQLVAAAGGERGTCEHHIARVPRHLRLRGVNRAAGGGRDRDRTARGNEAASAAHHTAEAVAAAEGNVGSAVALRHHGVAHGQHRRAAKGAAVLRVDGIAVALARRVYFECAARERGAAVGINAVAVRHVDVNVAAVLVIGEGLAAVRDIAVGGIDAVVGRVYADAAGIHVDHGTFNALGRFGDVDRGAVRSFRADIQGVVTLNAVIIRGYRDIARKNVELLFCLDGIPVIGTHILGVLIAVPDADVERYVFDGKRSGGEQRGRGVAVRVFFVEIIAALDAVLAVGVYVDRARTGDRHVGAVLALDDGVLNIGIGRFVGINVVVVVLVVGKVVHAARRGHDGNAAALVAGDGCGGGGRKRQSVQHQRHARDVFLYHDAPVRAGAGDHVSTRCVDGERRVLHLVARVRAFGYGDPAIRKGEGCCV